VGHSAIRRHHVERIKKKIRGYEGYDSILEEEHTWTPRIIGILSRTRCPCSGSCCGNPRKHWGLLTRQEIRCLDYLMQEWLAEQAEEEK